MGRRGTLISHLAHLFIGSFIVMVLCASVGLGVNRFRADRISVGINPARAETIESYKRNEILYVRAADFKTLRLSEYLFVDARSLPYYNNHRVANAIHYTMFDAPSLTKPVVFYGKNSDLRAVKEMVVKTIPSLYQPTYILVDGYDGWRRNGLPTDIAAE